MATVPVLNAEQWHAAALQLRRKLNKDRVMFAMYNSSLDAIVTDETLMSLPIDDHALVRGHALFDTCSVCNGRLYRLDVHLDRLFDGARKSRIPLPFAGDEDANRRTITDKIRRTVAASGKRDATVRYWLSVGPGNFGVWPTGCATTLYVLVFGGLPGMGNDLHGMSEATVRDVPMKDPFTAGIKSNNYLINVLTAMSATDRGGKFGILIDRKGFVAESAILNVIAVGHDGTMRTPHFRGILKGTTVRRCLELAREHLVPKGLVKEVSQCDVSEATLRDSKEIILTGGDTHVFPVVTLDGVAVADGAVGPVARELTRLIEADSIHGTGNHHTVQYDSRL
eukprot:TRINITY_DN2171_c0_g1_i4.p1 TRINITY_DN2171_c0_g1~~TRINITY_DN2171_c0_g1_i4.p1  ORF type:complete len:339 (+),score=80.11 TRINITY_DN2171_c0_g1_i4:52-1068(+)